MTKALLMRAAGMECSGSVMPMAVHVSDGAPSKSLTRSDASAYAYAKSAMSSNPRPRICSTSVSGTRALDSKLRMASADVTCSSGSAISRPRCWPTTPLTSRRAVGRHRTASAQDTQTPPSRARCWPTGRARTRTSYNQPNHLGAGSAADQDTATASSIAAALLSYCTIAQVDGLLAGKLGVTEAASALQVVAAGGEQLLAPRTSC